ncbi:MAG: choice-of-anchor J domain-containing protein [Chitinophagaceae bacterium]|nr:choice-of-anchor J domain-containing protein [Chitinophagaceae bacterium]
MNNFFKTSLSAIMFVVAVAAVGTSCKKKFDAPPAEAPAVSMTANTTIAQLKARHTVSGAIDKIDSGSDIIIRGIVIGDDRSGNLYKTIVIQDTTGGMAVLINGTNLYTSYPIGREVFIKCNNLYLSDYSNQIQLGGGIQAGSAPALADISTSTINNVIFKGTFNNVVTPKDVTPAQLGTSMQDKYQNTLIRISNAQFRTADTASTYASAGIISPSAASYDLEYCANISSPAGLANIELRTSNYSNFAATALPNGNGTITAIYTLYRTFKQLTIRDASDVKFTGPRCGFTPPPTGTVLLNENFESVTTTGTTPIALAGWKNIGPTAGTSYLGKTFSGNKYAQVSAFNSTVSQQLPTVKSWLITPVLNMNTTTNEKLTFGTIDGFNNGATLKVYYSTDYTGGADPTTSTWTQLTATIASGTTTGYAPAFVGSGNVSLGSITGPAVYIAFVYEGGYSPSAKTTTYQIDNVLVVGD